MSRKYNAEVIGQMRNSIFLRSEEVLGNSVTKLTDRKIRWIIREKMKEILSTNENLLDW